MIKLFFYLSFLLVTFSFSRESLNCDTINFINKIKTLPNNKYIKDIGNNTYIFNFGNLKKLVEKNPNISNNEEEFFQDIINITNLTLSVFDFKNNIGFQINNEEYKNLVLLIPKEILKKITNRDYKSTYTEVNNDKFIPPLYPLRNLFSESKIYNLTNDKLTYLKDITLRYKKYVKIHTFINSSTEDLVSQIYENYILLKESDEIFACIEHNDTECFNFFIKYNLNVNMKSSLGASPLLVASLFNRYDMTKILIDNGANPNYIPHNIAENAYLTADRLGHYKIATLLKPLTNLIDSNISPYNLKNMCIAITTKNLSFAYKSSSDDIENTCIGLLQSSVACHSIQDNDLKNLCLAKAEGQNSCYYIQDEDWKNMCLGITKFPYKCYDIQDYNKKAMCLGISEEKYHCYDIH